MKKYFVIGNPIDHSLSPKLHNYWFKENNIDAVYDKKKIDENNNNIVCHVNGFKPSFYIRVPYKSIDELKRIMKK